jgi:hypothetical protein
MQTLLQLCHDETSGRGRSLHDSTIEASPLTALIKQTFDDLQLPGGISGCIKLHQRPDNPDTFDLCFFSNVDSEAYSVNGTYSAGDIAVFKRTDFSDFTQTEDLLRHRLQEFVSWLRSGKLKPATRPPLDAP